MSANAAKIIGGFRVLQELQAGSGSQGTVYKATCAEDKHGLVPVGTVVALKVMPVQDGEGAQWRKLQKRTAELARLDHPNVVKYYGCFSEQGMFNDVHVVVQEFLQGVTLKERLARQKTGLDVDEGLRVVDSTLAGLDYMAQRGIVHRDLKPGNIFLCDDGGVKLIDFEIAKQEGGTVTASVGNIRGSFDYMAPDFTNPEFHGDVKSDVFSMGVVLHEVLSGKTPYERLEGDDKQANFAFLSRWSQTLSSGRSPIHVSSRVKRLLAHADEVLMHALAPDRKDRYRDFSAFRVPSRLKMITCAASTVHRQGWVRRGVQGSRSPDGPACRRQASNEGRIRRTVLPRGEDNAEADQPLFCEISRFLCFGDWWWTGSVSCHGVS